MNDDDEPSDTWGKLFDKESQEAFPYIEGGEAKESPEQRERERRLDKRRTFGMEQQKWHTLKVYRERRI